MPGSTDEIDWPAVTKLMPAGPSPEELRAWARARSEEPQRQARGLIEEARRRFHTEPVFHARVSQAAQAARLASALPIGEREAELLRVGASLALVLADRGEQEAS